MSQASTAAKAEPEAASAAPAAPTTQTPTTSYASTGWTSSRSYHPSAGTFGILRSNLIRNPHRSCFTATVCACHVCWTYLSLASTLTPIIGRNITPNSSIHITHRHHMATINLTSHPHKQHKRRHPGQLRLRYSVRRRVNLTLLMLPP
jgi:hypothetical protein